MSSQTQTKALVTTEWIAEHSKDSGLRLVEVDVDPSVYEKGHIEGAVGWNWKRDLQDQVARDIAPRRQSSCTATTTTGLPPTRTGP